MPDTNCNPPLNDTPTGSKTGTAAPPHRVWMVFVLICGVFGPIIAVVFEMVTRMCSSLFDPIPTAMHLALLLSVPAACFTATLAVLRQNTKHIIPIEFLLGLAMATAIIYSLMFIPFLPISLIGILACGLGLLGLTPYLSLMAVVVASKKLRDFHIIDHPRARISTWCGAIVAFLIMGGYFAICRLTLYGLDLSVSKDDATSLRGIHIIRTFGNMRALLRACYDLPANSWEDVAELRSVRRDWRTAARDAYYRVTGDSFNSVPPPAPFGSRSPVFEEFDFDSDVGGNGVNGFVRHLSMSSSRIDSTIDPNSLTAYTEWALAFTNNAPMDREACAEIALPPGGVVSRLTLWVNGEEREAVFSTRGKVTNAYRQVAVVQRRDPVLVTTCGPDRVLMQCFPVRRGANMIVRLGITSPLALTDLSKAISTLPHFVERNFDVPDGQIHSVLIKSTAGIAFVREYTPSKCIAATLTDDELNASRSTIACQRKPTIGGVYCPDPVDPKDFAIVQNFTTSHANTPANLVIVVDASKRMADSRSDIAGALAKLPKNTRFSIIGAGETVTELMSPGPATPDRLNEAASQIDSMRCVGGIDNRAALLKAFNSALARKDSAVLWIHGPQPLASDLRSQALLQLCERNPGKLRLITVAASDGRNGILAELETTGILTALPRTTSLQADLKSLFDSWGGSGSPTYAVERKRVPIAQATGLKVSSQIARLWAQDEVRRVCRLADSELLPATSQLAAAYRIVTAISGAVVLETEEQYKNTGLKPVNPNGVPSVVPEPASWLVLAVGIGFIAALGRRGKACHS